MTKLFSLITLVVSLCVLCPLFVFAATETPTFTLPEPDLVKAIKRITDWFFYFILLAAIIYILMGAFEFMRSEGDPTKAGTARTRIMFAAIAVLIALLARAIINFIAKKIGGL